MNHAELSKQLALALGYYPESVRVGESDGPILVHRNTWCLFDYRDPSVALAMVELLGDNGAFLRKGTDGWWCDGRVLHLSDHPLPEAAARAVIALKGMK